VIEEHREQDSGVGLECLDSGRLQGGEGGVGRPEIAALKVLRSGLLAIACDAVWPAIAGIDPAPVGTALR
jgi:hypothetical protein